MIFLPKCPENGCGFWCWLHDRLSCRWFRWLCYLADRHHYPDLVKWSDYR